MSKDNTPTLLGLPLETRVEIYRNLMGPRVYWYTAYHHPAEDREPNPKAPHVKEKNKHRAGILGRFPIMRVNKQINHEVMYALQVTALRIRPRVEIGELANASIHNRIDTWKDTIEKVDFHIDSREVSAIGKSEENYRSFYAGLSKLVHNLPNIQTLTITCGDCSDLSEELCQLFGEDLLNLCACCLNLVKQDRGGKWQSTFFRLERRNNTAGLGEITIVKQDNGVYKQSNGVHLPSWIGNQRGPQGWFH